MAGEVIAEVSSVEELRAVIVARRVELGLRQEDVNAAADLPDRYIGKVEARMRGVGAFSMLRLFPVLGLKLLVVKDDG